MPSFFTSVSSQCFKYSSMYCFTKRFWTLKLEKAAPNSGFGRWVHFLVGHLRLVLPPKHRTATLARLRHHPAPPSPTFQKSMHVPSPGARTQHARHPRRRPLTHRLLTGAAGMPSAPPQMRSAEQLLHVEMSAYEKQREANIARNRLMLQVGARAGMSRLVRELSPHPAASVW